jgi:AraC-like DNA-binding protein
MKLHIKNMVSDRCKIIVRTELQKLGIPFSKVELGEVEILGYINKEQQNRINATLKNLGFELLQDKKSIQIESVKNCIVEMVHYSEQQPKIKFSVFLSQRLNHDYTYLSNIFSENQGISIECYLLNQRLERIKELLFYDELNISEIAEKLHFSSTGHLSNQFKKMTGLTPSQYKHLSLKRRKPLEDV